MAKTRVTSQDIGDGLVSAADVQKTSVSTIAAVTLANGTVAMAFGTNTSVKVTPTATATYTTTVPANGTHVYLIVLTAGASSFTLTFGAGFKPSATLVTGTTAARVFVLSWISDGTNLYEVSRTPAMVA